MHGNIWASALKFDSGKIQTMGGISPPRQVQTVSLSWHLVANRDRPGNAVEQSPRSSALPVLRKGSALRSDRPALLELLHQQASLGRSPWRRFVPGSCGSHQERSGSLEETSIWRLSSSWAESTATRSPHATKFLRFYHPVPCST